MRKWGSVIERKEREIKKEIKTKKDRYKGTGGQEYRMKERKKRKEKKTYYRRKR